MDAARLQTVINRGYGIAATNIGGTFQHYRPASVSSVIAPANLLGSRYAAMAAHGNDFSFGRPDTHRDHYNNALFDPSGAQRFDYLVNATLGTWFIANLEPIKPPLVVRCDRTITLKRPGSGSPCGTIGLGGYGGVTAGNGTPLMSGWPASLSEAGSRGAKGVADLPMSAGGPMVEIMLPSWAGVILEPADIVEDDIGRRYVLRSAELTVFGWKLIAVGAVA